MVGWSVGWLVGGADETPGTRRAGGAASTAGDRVVAVWFGSAVGPAGAVGWTVAG